MNFECIKNRLKKGLTDRLELTEESNGLCCDSNKRPSISFDYGCLLYHDTNKDFVTNYDIPSGLNNVIPNDYKTRLRTIAQPVGTIKYVVSKRDTLRGLAALHETTSSELKKLNKLVTDTIFEGQTLFIPCQTIETSELEKSSAITLTNVDTPMAAILITDCAKSLSPCSINISNALDANLDAMLTALPLTPSLFPTSPPLFHAPSSATTLVSVHSASSNGTTVSSISPSPSCLTPAPTPEVTAANSTKLSFIHFDEGKFTELDSFSCKEFLLTGIKPILTATKNIPRDKMFSSMTSNINIDSSNNDDVTNVLASQEIIKMPVKHHVTDTKISTIVDGLLLLSREFVMFDPEATDPYVTQIGLEKSSVIIPVADVATVALSCLKKDNHCKTTPNHATEAVKKLEKNVIENEKSIEETNVFPICLNFYNNFETIDKRQSQSFQASNISNKNEPIFNLYTNIKITTDGNVNDLVEDDTTHSSRHRKRTKSSEDAFKETGEEIKNVEKISTNKKRASSVRNRPLSFVGNLFQLRNNVVQSSADYIGDSIIGTAAANSENNLSIASTSTKFAASSLDNINNDISKNLMEKTLSSISSYSNSIINDVSNHLLHPALSSTLISGSAAVQTNSFQDKENLVLEATSFIANPKDRIFLLRPIDLLTEKVKKQLYSSTEPPMDCEDDKKSDLLLTIETLKPSTPSHQQQQIFVFSVPRKKTSLLYSFFLYWTPNFETVNITEPYFMLIPDDRNSDDKSNEDSTNDDSAKYVNDTKNRQTKCTSNKWKIVNVEEMKRAMMRMEIDRLPPPELSHASHILTEAHIKQLTFNLPARAEGCVWHLAYSTERHGFSIRTLFRKMEKVEGPVLLIVKDDHDVIFGAMLSQTLKPSEVFYGSGECYLFTFRTQFLKYSWTGSNNFFIYGGNNCISIGSGDGAHGLWFDEDLFRGRTQRCLTFNNDLLTEAEDFVVKYLETWRFI
ncbi:hypothetical protein HELRODRAFT_193374 [Helobdella robusta]|uniref:Oxidation resistance protein 1 n=1 Tax=Helobdella robusta TaxID=6412 RepID=T1FUX5_HELRO|nr:hypothetical protein HELRODRAFT_193374 [Helobdella robusta]ESN96810.1 hypothetical protein HELRODRAFT_193374 [Helobdella robusta]